LVYICISYDQHQVYHLFSKHVYSSVCKTHLSANQSINLSINQSTDYVHYNGFRKVSNETEGHLAVEIVAHA